MKRPFVTALALPVLLSIGVADAARAQTPTELLLVAPPGADHFVVVSEAGKHGDEWRWTLPDGRVAYRQSFGLRGQVFERDEVVGYDAEGKPVTVAIRGVTPRGDAAESLATNDGVARWKSPVDEGEARAGQAIYYPYGGTFLADVETLLAPLRKAGAGGVDLLPSGHATLTPASSTLKVEGSKGSRTLHLWFINGLGQSPQPVWLDGDGALFGSVGNLGVLPAGYEDALKPMIAAQDAAIAQLAPAIAQRLLTDEAKEPVLFRNVKLYDADNLRFVENQNVLVANGKIASVGADAPVLPAGTRVVDGAGKTLVPGLWDSHMHIGNDFDALSEVAIGVTSVRSPGTTIDYAVSARERRQAGTLVAPEAFVAAIIDRKGPLAAQGFPAVESLDETLAEVRKIKAAGLFGVKFYTSMQPEWIPPAAKLAHELGLHVSGHIPAGMRTLDAVDAGYDEITHIYFATMQAMPDDVVAKSNTTLRLTGPGRYFKDAAFDQEPLKSTIATLAEKRIAVDPTLVVLERVLLAEAGTMGASYAPYAGTLPPTMERSFRSGGIPLPEGTTRDDVRASFKHMVEYVNVLRNAGVPIVAGTDGWGIELVRELELYVQGGMTSAQALATATIAAARNVGVEARTGSIAVGKEADLLLVDGDVESNIGNLRQVEAVVLDGALLDGDALRKEAGFSGKPSPCVDACADTQRPQADKALAEQVRREILPLFEAMQAAAQAADADAHVAFWARQPEPLFVGSFRGSEVKLAGWDAILEKQREWWAGAKPDPADPAYGLLEGPDVVVTDPGHAVLHFVLEGRFRDADQRLRKNRLLISQLWQKQADGWKVVFTHESTGREIPE